MSYLPRQRAVLVFLAFAVAYFLSTLIRAVTATLAPTLTVELNLQASDLGLLAGAYFLGFSLTQLPLGRWLDRYGPKRVILSFLVIAVAGCVAFATSTSFTGLLAARAFTGIGVSACLMAPLTAYRHWFAPQVQMRANSWMLMTGSLGMLASTLPVQWLLPLVGWRGLFLVLAVGVGLAMVFILWQVPQAPTVAVAPPSAGQAPNAPNASNAPQATPEPGLLASYLPVWQSTFFRSQVLMGFFVYGGMLAVQTLWAGPWLQKVAHQSAAQAAQGMFVINLAMLCTFWTWGLINPWLTRRGLAPNTLIARGLPLSFVVLAAILWLGESLQAGAPYALAAYCVTSTFVTLAQPAVGMAFPTALAGRALSAYNLLIFAGVFAVQWGIGLSIDGLQKLGLSTADAFRASMSGFLCCGVLSYLVFLRSRPDNLKP